MLKPIPQEKPEKRNNPVLNPVDTTSKTANKKSKKRSPKKVNKKKLYPLLQRLEDLRHLEDNQKLWKLGKKLIQYGENPDAQTDQQIRILIDEVHHSIICLQKAQRKRTDKKRSQKNKKKK